MPDSRACTSCSYKAVNIAYRGSTKGREETLVSEHVLKRADSCNSNLFLSGHDSKFVTGMEHHMMHTVNIFRAAIDEASRKEFKDVYEQQELL